MDTTLQTKPWFLLSPDETLAALKTDRQNGLASEEAASRLKQYGPNTLPEAPRPGLVRRFFKQLNNVLIYVLLFAAGVTFFMGHSVDTAVILLVVLINAVIGFVQESRAEKAMDAIKNILALEAQVVRGGQRQEVAAVNLTPGDLVLLKPGDKVPADLRLLQADNLTLEESALTGEAVPSEKNTEALSVGAALGDRDNMAFSGGNVASGTGQGVVVAVGGRTEIGKIKNLLDEVQPTVTPLIRQMDRLSRDVSLFIVVLSVAVYLFARLYRNYEHGTLLLSVIGLAIGAIPEGLPAIMSIILALGVQSMAKRNAIVRNLPSVETLGSVSVICSDKTGTLTKNEMTVTDLVTRDGEYKVEGVGYAPEGIIRQDEETVTPANEGGLARLMDCFKICNEAEVVRDESGVWTVKGAPTEGALLTAWRKSGLPDPAAERIDVLPFDSKNKYMAVLACTGEDMMIFIKGAPDRLVEMADREETPSGPQAIDRDFWKRRVSDLAGQGQRTIAAACKKIPGGKDCLTQEDLGGGVVFLGLAGIVDPPREEAVEAVAECQDAGITVKMITGDHKETALSIAAAMGIGDGLHALEGRELDAMNDDQLRDAARKYDVFARTSPENKLQLVKAIQAAGGVCAMTGDGVNDAPALKKADVGIAMGVKGTEVTKEAAEIVLADDNFSTIAAAVEEGRKVYDNLRKTILFVLPTNGAECFLIMASIIFGTMLSLTPVQILWVNMVTSVTVSMALAFEPLDPAVMTMPPRDPAKPIIDNYFIWRIFWVSVLIGGGTLWLALLLMRDGDHSETVVRTITMQAIVFSQMFHLFNSRSIRRSAFCCGFFTNPAVFVVGALMVLLQLAVTYLPFMNRIFGTHPLPLSDWWYPAALGLVVFVVVEIEKWIMRLWDRRAHDRLEAHPAPRVSSAV